MRSSLSFSFASAFVLTLIFGLSSMDAMAQVESQDLTPSEVIPDNTFCGPPIQLPEGAQVIQKEDFLLVTLPQGYDVSYDEHGVPSFTYNSSLSKLGKSGPTLIFSETAVPINCDCVEHDEDDEDAECEEYYDVATNEVRCRKLHGCLDCTLCVGSCDDE